jgi:hypothetical protein
LLVELFGSYDEARTWKPQKQTILYVSLQYALLLEGTDPEQNKNPCKTGISHCSKLYSYLFINLFTVYLTTKSLVHIVAV